MHGRRQGRRAGALAWSLTIHAAAGGALWLLARGPAPPPEPPSQVEIEIVEAPAARGADAPAAAGPVADAPVAAGPAADAPAVEAARPRPRPPRPARRAAAPPPRGEGGAARGGEAEAPPPAPPPGSPGAPPGPSGAAPPPDRFWSLRGASPGGGAPGIGTAAPAPGLVEAPRNPLLAPPPAVRGAPRPPRQDLQGEIDGRSGVKAKIAADGSIAFEDPPSAKLVAGKEGIGARFDLNDLVARAIGEDPYSYEKGRIAEATREARLCMAVKEEEARKRRALLQIGGQLEAIWRRGELAPAERRALIFDLWDDCVEEARDGAAATVAAARASIEAFVRRVLPAGSRDAFTPAELAQLNARRTARAPFAPYAPPGRAPRVGTDAGAPR